MAAASGATTRLVLEKVLDMLPTLLPATDEARDPETSEPQDMPPPPPEPTPGPGPGPGPGPTRGLAEALSGLARM